MVPDFQLPLLIQRYYLSLWFTLSSPAKAVRYYKVKKNDASKLVSILY